MTFPASVDTVPLERWGDGSIRVTGSRVPLDHIVDLWTGGESPEAIREAFPSLALSDIYAVITYFLRHRPEVEDYLAEQQRLNQLAERSLLERFPQDEIRKRLMARRPS